MMGMMTMMTMETFAQIVVWGYVALVVLAMVAIVKG